MGTLSVSRAIGDVAFKGERERESERELTPADLTEELFPRLHFKVRLFFLFDFLSLSLSLSDVCGGASGGGGAGRGAPRAGGPHSRHRGLRWPLGRHQHQEGERVLSVSEC